MEETKGHCKHGTFPLREGCAQCVAEQRAEAEVNSPENIKKRIEAVQPKAEDTMEVYVSGKTFSQEELEPNPETIGAELAEEAGIAPDPNAWRIGEEEVRPEQEEMEEGLNSEGLTLTGETALALRPGEDIEAHGYFEEALKLLKYAEGRVITKVEDVKMATDDLSVVAKLKKAMESKRKSLLAPLKAEMDDIRDTYNYLMAPVLEADKITRDKILGFNKEQERIRLEQEEINRKRQEAAEAEMRLKGELSESVNLVEVAPEAPKRVSTDMGTTGQRDNWKYEVVDFAQLPDDYKMINAGVLTRVVKASKGQITIPGIRIFNEPILAVTTK